MAAQTPSAYVAAAEAVAASGGGTGPSTLGLGHRILVFGGGKQAEARGGIVRAIKLTDGAPASDEVIMGYHRTMEASNPLYKTR